MSWGFLLSRYEVQESIHAVFMRSSTDYFVNIDCGI